MELDYKTCNEFFLRPSPLTTDVNIMLSFVIQNEYLNMKY